MFRRIGLVPMIVAAAAVVAACGERSAEAPANNAVSTGVPVAGQNTTLAQGVPTGDECGGIANRQCASEADFCKGATGQCGTPDAQGLCTTRPQVCTREREPVCGCDGTTYGNACEADRAGVSVQSLGECPGSDG